MASRGHRPPTLERRPVQAPGLMRHGPFPSGHQPFDTVPRQDLLENKIAAQAAEIEQLAGENRRLAATHVALREDLVTAQQKLQQLKAHIRSIQTESDIQMRILLDKIMKLEADIRAGENVKKDLTQAHVEAQNLVKARQELTAQIQQASQELQKVQADVKSLPDLQAELDNFMLEHKRLRAIFEYEKGSNIEMVEQLQVMEQNLIGMAREVEKLHAEVSNAEKRTCGPNLYGGGYLNPQPRPSYPQHPAHGGGGAYVDAYGRPLVQMGAGSARNGTALYSSGNVTAAMGEVVSGSNAGVAAWGGAPYDPSHTQR